jgi:hypothetical protein
MIRSRQGADFPGPNAGTIPARDEILLMSGNYGAIGIGQYHTEFSNSGFVTIAAAPGQTPVLSSLWIFSIDKLALILSLFSGLIPCSGE